MKTINIVSVTGVEFIIKQHLQDADSLEDIEVIKVYSRKRNIDLKPFLSENCLWMIEQELRERSS